MKINVKHVNIQSLKKRLIEKKREAELIELLSKYKKKTGYDCVVPGSGGRTVHIQLIY